MNNNLIDGLLCRFSYFHNGNPLARVAGQPLPNSAYSLVHLSPANLHHQPRCNYNTCLKGASINSSIALKGNQGN